MAQLFDPGPDIYGGTKHPANPCVPAKLGTGPEGETCGKCRHYRRVGYRNKAYAKCRVMMHEWTHGEGSDIKARWAACAEYDPADCGYPIPPKFFIETPEDWAIAADWWEDHDETRKAALCRHAARQGRTPFVRDEPTGATSKAVSNDSTADGYGPDEIPF